MKMYHFEPSGGHIEISVNGRPTYRWPLSSPDRRFTAHLLSKLLPAFEQHRLLVMHLPIAMLVPDNALDFYLPPAYRPLSPEPSLWERFINLFKKENHHARNQHDQRPQ